MRAQDLLVRTNIPPAYLQKVLRKLVEAGLLASRRGHGGGFVLARRPVEIRFVDVLRAVEVDPVSTRCAFGFPKCDAKRPCPLHGFRQSLQDHLLEQAARTTLADVTCDPARRPGG